MGTVLLAAGVLAALFLLGHAGGWRIAVSAIAIGVLACFPGREVLGASTSALAILVVAAVGLISSRRVTLPWRFAPLLVYLLLLATVQWNGGEAMWDRIAELALACLAWVVGAFLRDAVDGRITAQRVFVLLLLGVLTLQAVVAGLQYLGVDIFTSTGPNADLTEGRSTGTFSHPGNLGKVVFFITMMLLPLSLSPDRLVRRTANVAILLSLVPVGFSESRANFIALLTMLVGWAIISPRTSGAVRGRLLIPGAVLIVGLVFLEPILDRFASDPEGGARVRLMDVALAHIWDNPWFGVGPAMYTSYFGQFDIVTARGWPVHNAFVLQAAELGLLGAVLLFVPLLVAPAISAVKASRVVGDSQASARALLAAIPGIIIIAITGWSLTNGDIANMLFLSLGYMVTGLRGGGASAGPAVPSMTASGSAPAIGRSSS